MIRAFKILCALAYLANSAAYATQLSRCLHTFAAVNTATDSLVIMDEKVDDEGWHFWRVRDTSGRSGIIDFKIMDPTETHPYTHISIRDLAGVVGQPGVGTLLKQKVHDRHPGLPFVSRLIETNQCSIVHAVQLNPSNPNFADVPCIRALDYRFEVDFEFERQPDGKLELGQIEVRQFPPETPNAIWSNKDEVLSDPLYLEWVQGGAQTSPAPEFYD